MLKNKLILFFISFITMFVFLFSAAEKKSLPSVSSSASNVSVELSSSSETVDKSSNDKGISVDKGMLSVEIVFPANFFEDTTEDEVIATAKESGIEAIKNDDGSYTYKMSKSKYNELLTETKDNIDEYISQISDDTDYESIKKVEADDNYENFKLYVDKENFENSLDGLIEFGLYMQSAYYRIFSGKDVDKFQVYFTIIDNSNNSEISTDVYPTDEMLQQSETGSNQ